MITVRCDDTDVLVLLIHFYMKYRMDQEVFLSSGKRHLKRFISIKELCTALEEPVCILLPFFHALTGCDTTSSFFGHGKKSAFRIFKRFLETSTFEKITESSIETAFELSQKYILMLYNAKAATDLNELRFHLAVNSNKKVECFPPTNSSTLQHVLRALYQTIIWINSNQSSIDINPRNFGYKESSSDPSVLIPHFMEQDAAPPELRKLVDLTCKDKRWSKVHKFMRL